MKRIYNLNNKKVIKAISKLNNIYKDIPETKGCLENINKLDGCGGWCCKFQSPQVLYCEFLNTWKFILQNWDFNSIIDLIEKSIRNYFNSFYSKGCIFWDEKTKLCKQHRTRPYICKMYGIIPEEEFKPRYEALKLAHNKEIGAVIKDQCNLVKTVDNKKSVTKEESDLWWKSLLDVEMDMGIKKSEIRSYEKGSYLTYHDHVLLQFFSENLLLQMTDVKLSKDKMIQEIFIKDLINSAKVNLQKIMENFDEKEDQKS